MSSDFETRMSEHLPSGRTTQFKHDDALKTRAHRLGGVRRRRTAQRNRCADTVANRRTHTITASWSWSIADAGSGFVAESGWLCARVDSPVATAAGAGAASAWVRARVRSFAVPRRPPASVGPERSRPVSVSGGGGVGFGGAPPPPRPAGRGSGIQTSLTGSSRVTFCVFFSRACETRNRIATMTDA